MMRRYSLRWFNPYTEPPEGMPRFLAEEIVPWDQQPLNLLRMTALGDGYALCCTPLDEKPPRKLSEATKQSIRRKALQRRVFAKAPLFAAELIDQQMQKQPDYYGKADK